jgi:hypothetical protein
MPAPNSVGGSHLATPMCSALENPISLLMAQRRIMRRQADVRFGSDSGRHI